MLFNYLNLSVDSLVAADSCNRRRNVEDQSVSNAQLHFTLTISYVSDPLDFIDELIMSLEHSNANPVKVLLIDISRANGGQHSLAD